MTASYRPGLFRWRDVKDLPRTNNDLEQLFGSYRHHERRCCGRKAASPGMVVRGSVRLVASTATRLRPIAPAELIPADPAAWRGLRRDLDARRLTRTQGRRFRKDPEGFLRSIEDVLLNETLLA